MFVLMSDVWPALKYENNCASFKENYSLKLVIAFKMAYSCCFSLGGGGELRFSRISQIKF